MLQAGVSRWKRVDLASRTAELDKIARLYGRSAEEILRHAGDLAGSRPALIAGSLVDGVGNECSDLDLLIFDEQEEVMAVSSLGELRIDIEVWRPSRLARCSELVASGLDMSRKVRFIGQSNRAMVHSLFIGIPVSAPDEVHRLRRAIDEETYRIYNARRLSERTDAAIQDVVGALLNGEPEFALLLGRQALDDAIDGFLAVLGDTAHNGKHRFAKMQKRMTGGEALLADYRTAMGSWPGELSEVETQAVRNGHLARSIFLSTIRAIASDPLVVWPPSSEQVDVEPQELVAPWTASRPRDLL